MPTTSYVCLGTVASSSTYPEPSSLFLFTVILLGGHCSAGKDALGAPKEATLRSLPAAPLCRCGSICWPQLCLALDQLQVLSSGKGRLGMQRRRRKVASTPTHLSSSLALRLLHCHFPVSLSATSHGGDEQHLCPAPRGFVLPLWPSPQGRAVQVPASARRLGSSRHSGCFSSLSAAPGQQRSSGSGHSLGKL